MVVGAVATVIAAFAYLRVALAVATNDDDGEEPVSDDGPDAVAVKITARRRVDVYTGLVLFVAAGMTLVLGIVPGVFVDWASHAGFFL